MVLLDLAQVLPIQNDAACRGPVQGGQNVQKRGLAGAGFAHDGHVFSLLHAEADGTQGLHLIGTEPGGIDLPDLADFQYFHCLFSSLRFLGLL